jgi:hypothetical protein
MLTVLSRFFKKTQISLGLVTDDMRKDNISYQECNQEECLTPHVFVGTVKIRVLPFGHTN